MTDTKSGIVFIHKQEGITSFRTLDTIKKNLGTKKIGHAGTLDKFASGVLIVLAGKMTKLADSFSGMEKEYEAVFCFGKQTSTLDPEGEIIKTGTVPDLDKISENLSSFRGELLQIPPRYSAVHVAGKRAYKMARNGDIPDLKSRKITIYDFSILGWNPPYLRVHIRCSKGTYVRALARDLGTACGSCAYVTSLVRTKIGSVSLEDTHTPDTFVLDKHLVTGKNIFSFLPDINIMDVDKDTMTRIKYGKELKREMFPGNKHSKKYFALFYNDTFLALVKKTTDKVHYRFVSGVIPW